MTTELSNLPSDPGVPQTNMAPQQPAVPENIKMETTAYRNDLDSKPSVPPIADPKQMTEMVSNLQNAAKQGLTSLAEDIPKETTHITQDAQTVANSIPDEPVDTNATPIDYIQNFATQEEIANQLSKQENKQDTLDFFLEELKWPLILSVLFYIFQSKNIHKVILSRVSFLGPFLFNDTGGYNSNGLIALSAAFGATYYAGTKVMKHFSL